MKKKLCIGILAHVDAGKTTLCEAVLYAGGVIRNLGRVDSGNAFLDTDKIEKDRGITIFSKQAAFEYGDTSFSLIDTPGHVDFSQEAEAALSVLDYAVLVVSASDGVQSHTESLWRALEKYKVPIFIFVNKMDLSTADGEKTLAEIKNRLSESCVVFAGAQKSFDGGNAAVKEAGDAEDTDEKDCFMPIFSETEKESIALCSEELMEEFLSGGHFSENAIAKAVKECSLFPVFFGSALKNIGVRELLSGICTYGISPCYGEDFGARVFKISEDEKGQKLVHIKVTGGTLKVKDTFIGEKVSEIRIYSGAKYKSVPKVSAGETCALTGLFSAYLGQGLGFENDIDFFEFQPIFLYRVNIENEDIDNNTALKYLKRLEEEVRLNVSWNKALNEIQISLMGKVQAEVLKRIIKERFKMDVSFEKAGVLYKETVLNTVEGVGHYEPLRHYAEVHLLLEPGKRGSGLKFASSVSEDELDKNWQRLILTHLKEKEHKGVLCGFPITDMKITLIAGRAHKKHTEGGDFRQATYRAVRQGLMQAQCELLEPWYAFRLELPRETVGRAMNDIQGMGAKFSAPEIKEAAAFISGSAPAALIGDYQKEVISYTHGAGRLSLTFDGYQPCSGQAEVIESIGYDPEADTENTPDSVFCVHGAGFTVKWDKVFDYMHIEKRKEKKEVSVNEPPSKARINTFYDEDELIRIFERTYGKIERKSYQQMKTPKSTYAAKSTAVKKALPKEKKPREEYLLVDGYNILFAWYSLEGAKKEDLDLARSILIQRLSNYKAVKDINIILVFDAYKVKGGRESVEKEGNISVVYTKEAETADSYIERTAKELKKNYSVRVATSDRLEQIIIFGGGAERVSESGLLKELLNAENEINEHIRKESAASVYPEHEIKEDKRKKGGEV